MVRHVHDAVHPPAVALLGVLENAVVAEMILQVLEDPPAVDASRVDVVVAVRILQAKRSGHRADASATGGVAKVAIRDES